MTIVVKLKDGKGCGFDAKVTKRGQLIVAPLEFSDPYFVYLDTINIAYNLIKPTAGKQFVITSILVNSNVNVGAIKAKRSYGTGIVECFRSVSRVKKEIKVHARSAHFTPIQNLKPLLFNNISFRRRRILLIQTGKDHR